MSVAKSPEGVFWRIVAATEFAAADSFRIRRVFEKSACDSGPDIVIPMLGEILRRNSLEI